MTSRLVLVIAAAIAVMSIATARAQDLIMCYGEHKRECDSRYPNAFGEFIGTSDPEVVARATCRVRGSSDAPKYRITKRGTQGGNCCGYALFDVFCER